MIAELAMTMLACARIGAVHSVVFAGFSAESLKGKQSVFVFGVFHVSYRITSLYRSNFRLQ